MIAGTMTKMIAGPMTSYFHTPHTVSCSAPTEYTDSIHKTVRRPTRTIMIGDVAVGSQHPIRVQTMTTTDTKDVDATVDQVRLTWLWPTDITTHERVLPSPAIPGREDHCRQLPLQTGIPVADYKRRR